MFEKILIANRGEIACRIIETAQKKGIKTVAVYSEIDANSRHVRLADEAYKIGAAEASESYLNGDIIIETALKCGAEAIHPGYGFLSENAEFAKRCEEAELRFIGPTPHSISLMGLKDQAKAEMIKAGVPVVPGYDGENQDENFLKEKADAIGYPLLIKAVAGGGGKGMRLVENKDDFFSSLNGAKNEAKGAFGNDRVILEKYIRRARHIEVQVFADMVGNAVYLHERDCSLQRRHQKVVEEAPAPDLSEDMRYELGETAIKAVKAIKYRGAGTIEFIVDVEHGLKDAPFYFMEMNTRLQVEHPVTEMITGIDLVEWQLRIAAGERLPLSQKDIKLDGHAFEVRIYAEDPANGFLPQTGKLHHFSYPDETDNLRLDTGIEEGDEVSIYYDPMIAKLIVWGQSRSEAIRHMRRALSKTAIAGVKTNLEFLYNIFNRKAFNVADFDTGFIDKYIIHLTPEADHVSVPILTLAALYELMPHSQGTDIWDRSDGWQLNTNLKISLTFLENQKVFDIAAEYKADGFDLEVLGKKYHVKLVNRMGDDLLILLNGEKISGKVVKDGNEFTVFSAGKVTYLNHFVPGIDANESDKGDGVLIAPMPGKIARLIVSENDQVEKGDPLMILEAMKMEHTMRSPITGKVQLNGLSENKQVQDGQTLLRIVSGDEND